MKTLIFILQILNVFGVNEVRWPKEKHFSWAKEVSELGAQDVFALKGLSK